MSFQPSDTVKLKSGGVPMTVESISDGLVDCVWQEGKDIKRDAFPSVVLEAWTKPKVTSGVTVARMVRR